MPPFVGRAGKAPARRKRQPVAARSIAIEALDLTVGARTARVRSTGLTHIGWSVFANSPPDYPWYAGGGDGIAVGAGGVNDLAITLFNPGDRLKVFASAAGGAAAARDFTVMAESGFAVAATGGGTPGATGPAALISKMGLGINQERNTVWQHPGAQTPAYYQRYRDMGVRQVRLFATYPQSWGIDGSYGSVDPWMAAVRACVDSGMPVTWFDCADVSGYEHQGAAMDAYVAMCGDRLAAMNLPVDRFIVGAINEYAGGTNAEWRPHRVRLNQILRSKLPNHTIAEGPCNWKDIRALAEPNFVPWAGQPEVGPYVPWEDTNTIQDVHHYLGWDLAGMTFLAQQALDWARNNGGRQVVSGEWGFGDLQNDVRNLQLWLDRFEGHSQQVAIQRIRPILWAVTDGEDWRMNEYGGNTMRPGMDTAVPRWAGRVAAQAPPPPPPAADPGTPTGPQATRARDFWNTISINTHFSHGTELGDQYTNAQRGLESLQYCGITAIRDHFPDYPEETARYAVLANAGIKIIFEAMPGYSPQWNVDRAKEFLAAHPGSIRAIEGPNEIDVWPFSYNGLSGIDAAMAYQQDLYNAVRNTPQLNGIPVYKYTIANGPPTQTGACDWSNIHGYLPNGRGAWELDWFINYQRNANPGKPIALTEVGYHEAIEDDPWGGVDRPTAAKLLLNTVFRSDFYGVGDTCIYQLLDHERPGARVAREGSFGIFDINWNAKPAANAFRNLNAILADGSNNARTFTPSKLNYTVSGSLTQGASKLMQRSNGAFLIAVWNEPSVWDANANAAINPAAQTATVNFGKTFGTVRVYDPMVGQAAQSTASNASSVQVSLTGHPKIVELVA